MPLPADLSIDKGPENMAIEGDLTETTEQYIPENELHESSPAWKQFLNENPGGEEPLPEWQQRLLEIGEPDNKNQSDNQSTTIEMEMPASEDILPAWLRQLSRTRETDNPNKVDEGQPAESQVDHLAGEGNHPDLEQTSSNKAFIGPNETDQEVPNLIVVDDTGLEEILPEWVQQLEEDSSDSPEAISETLEIGLIAPDIAEQERITADILPEWVQQLSEEEEITDDQTKPEQTFLSGDYQEYPSAGSKSVLEPLTDENDETGFSTIKQGMSPINLRTEDEIAKTFHDNEAPETKDVEEIESIDAVIDSRKEGEFAGLEGSKNILPEWLLELEDTPAFTPEEEAKLISIEESLSTDEGELLEWLQTFSESGEIALMPNAAPDLLRPEQIFSKEAEKNSGRQVFQSEVEGVNKFFQVDKIDENEVEVESGFSGFQKDILIEIGQNEQSGNLPSVDEEINIGTQSFEDQSRSEEAPVAGKQVESEISGLEREELPDWLRGLEEQALTDTDTSNKLVAGKPEWLESGTSQILSEPASTIDRVDEESRSSIVNLIEGETAKSADHEDKNGLDEAVSEYEQRLNEGKNIESLIEEVKAKIYEQPDDFVLWQVLGDAYFKVNQIQNALDAYQKAEELIR